MLALVLFGIQVSLTGPGANGVQIRLGNNSAPTLADHLELIHKGPTWAVNTRGNAVD